MSSAPTVVFWDIDGTLLTTARAGIFAWEDALRLVTGLTQDLSGFRTAGLLDTEIALRLLESVGHHGQAKDARAMCDAYCAALPGRLGARRGTVLPNVRENLVALRASAGARQYLLTGNLRAGARAKLRHYGLADLLDLGAFADDAPDRAGIARRALELAREAEDGALDPDRTYVIGDTPHDIACGRSIGARTIAVATGVNTLEELRACGPWLALEQLPQPEELLPAIGL